MGLAQAPGAGVSRFARAVFAFTLLFFAAFFLWPILQILKGGFVDADGRLWVGTEGRGLARLDPREWGGAAPDDAAAARIKAAGGALIDEPADRPWGVRMFQFRDPDGFKLGVSTPLAG